MKKLTILLTFLTAFFFARAQDAGKITQSLQQGNAAAFSGYFDNLIDLKLPEKDELKNVGKNQAGIAVKNFFDSNGIKGFDATSQREMGGTMYITGKLQGKNTAYNLTLLMKVRGDNLSIITVRIN